MKNVFLIHSVNGITEISELNTLLHNYKNN